MSRDLRRRSGRPFDLTSVTVLAERHPHGTRVRYICGCHCVPCRAAASRYETDRYRARQNGDWNGIVAADRARAHLQKLSRQGVGRRAVADACDVRASTLHDIKMGRKRWIRARTERAILGVDRRAAAAGALVPAGPTRRRVTRLLAAGFTKTELARRLGYKSPALQLRILGQITARNEARIARIYNVVMEGA